MMPVYSDSDPDLEVIYQLLGLLPTIEEALQHLQVQLGELRLEESAALFKNTAEAVASIASCLPTLLSKRSEGSMLRLTAGIREGIAMVIDAYEHNDLAAIQSALDHRLIPAFLAWQQELARILRPSVLS